MTARFPQLQNLRAVALGRIPGSRHWVKFGYLPNADATSSSVDIWNGGGVYTGFPTGSAETVSVTSTDAADTSDGAGVRAVLLTGLGENGEHQTETIATSGTTPAAGSALWTRIYRAFAVSAGALQANAGMLTVRHTTTTGNVFAVIPVGGGNAQVALFTVAAGHEGLLTSWGGAASNDVGTRAEADMTIRIRVGGTSAWLDTVKAVVSTDGGNFRMNLDGGLRLPAMTDLVIRADDATAAGLDLASRFEIVEVPL